MNAAEEPTLALLALTPPWDNIAASTVAPLTLTLPTPTIVPEIVPPDETLTLPEPMAVTLTFC